MLSYTKPTVIDCGTSESVIQGECGWGAENLTMDKTGAKKNKDLRMTYQVACAGPGVVNVCTRCHTVKNQCNTKSHEC
ncbi:hypothetical protein [Priestia megaterium]|uniref:hypothetical protein n=1 Tax=Priestia megaterium TaxID=1404 RepID=UPI0025B07BF2|nr:hypothetical protein [Priestia megaterium]MDN3233551.1 hypothetical protein [Priestia megaterium]